MLPLDEEPPADIFSESLTRTNVGGGPVWLMFTPLQGISEVVHRFKFWGFRRIESSSI